MSLQYIMVFETAKQTSGLPLHTRKPVLFETGSHSKHYCRLFRLLFPFLFFVRLLQLFTHTLGNPVVLGELHGELRLSLGK